MPSAQPSLTRVGPRASMRSIDCRDLTSLRRKAISARAVVTAVEEHRWIRKAPLGHRGLPVERLQPGVEAPESRLAHGRVVKRLELVAQALLGLVEALEDSLVESPSSAAISVRLLLLQSQQGHDTHEDLVRRERLKNRLARMRDRGEVDGIGFYRELAGLVWATRRIAWRQSLRCTS